MQTDGWASRRLVYGHVIAKFYRMGSFPHFLPMVLCCMHFARMSSAIKGDSACWSWWQCIFYLCICRSTKCLRMKLCCEYWFLSVHDALQVLNQCGDKRCIFCHFSTYNASKRINLQQQLFQIQTKTCWEEFLPHNWKKFKKSVIPVFPENQIFHGCIKIKSDNYVDVKCTLTTINYFSKIQPVIYY